ncbi:MAG: ATP-binding protein [Spirulinaceae cyanobacterium]
MVTSHFLIGVPGSGKSTFAQTLAQAIPDAVIISTDAIRSKLFGQEDILDQWPEVEAELIKQMEEAVATQKTIIYDATNFKRSLRLELLQKLGRLQLQWVAWYLKTPLEVCYRQNQKRNRRVPEEVIDQMNRYLRSFPPHVAEGFVTVKVIKPHQEKFASKAITKVMEKLPLTIATRSSRTTLNSHLQLHQYSLLVDFERLIYLISFLINFSSSHPPLSVVEITAEIGREYGQVYADENAIATDLAWLEKNGFCNSLGKGEATTQEITLMPLGEQEIITHQYSDREPFLRLLGTIRFLIHHPFTYNSDAGGSLNSLIAALREEGIITYNYADRVRKDIEKVLKPYGIMPNHPQKKGYYAGTAILSETELKQVFSVLQSQAASLNDPVAVAAYQKLGERLGLSKIDQEKVYPIRAIGTSSIIDTNRLAGSALLNKLEVVEKAIYAGELLELKPLAGGGRFASDEEEYFRAFPLQIVFHNLAWYLGYEKQLANKETLFKFQRLDRLFLARKLGKARGRNSTEKSLTKLQRLYEASAGIYLGATPQQQQAYLSRDKKRRSTTETVVELWCNDYSFQFISEGTKRFRPQQLAMSPAPGKSSSRMFTLKPTGDKKFPYRFQVTLPSWSLDDVDLLTWVVAWGEKIKVIRPQKLVDYVTDFAINLSQLYEVGKQD